MALFERNKNIKIDLIEKGLLKVETSMLDNIHHITTIFHVSFPKKEIIHAEADFRRAPYVGVCRQTSNLMKNLIGLKIRSKFTQKVIEAIGEKKGCHHLVDLTLEMPKGLMQFLVKSQNLPLKEYINDASMLREKILEAYPQITDMCWAYNGKNQHLFTKDTKCGLQEDLAI